jgi:ubiquinone/menaquinone biosynthesis C-methylase UbiE
VQVAGLVIASARDVHDPDVVSFPVSDNPSQSARYVFVQDPRRRPDLHQHYVGFRSYAPVEASGKQSVAGRDDGSHHSVPGRHVGLKQVSAACPADKAHIFDNAVARLGQIGMGVEPGIQKRYCYASSAEYFRRFQPHRGRQYFEILVGELRKTRRERLLKFIQPVKAIHTDLAPLPPTPRVGLQNLFYGLVDLVHPAEPIRAGRVIAQLADGIRVAHKSFVILHANSSAPKPAASEGWIASLVCQFGSTGPETELWYYSTDNAWYRLQDMSTEKELAYRYDLFTAPDWRERFDSLLEENFKIPSEGILLEVNCGTGAYGVQLAERMQGKGEVIGFDPSPERLDLARARAQVLKLSNLTFKLGDALDVPFEDNRFDAVIGDASILDTGQVGSYVERMLLESARVARKDAPVLIKIATRGSFDEFFSIYWEALYDLNLVDQVLKELEPLINERLTIADAEELAARAGLRKVESVTSKEEFLYDSGQAFFESPTIADNFLPSWLSIISEDHRAAVVKRVEEIIDRERNEAPFEVSIKATVVAGVK